MNEPGEFLKRLEDLTNRRCWLLYEALRCLPLDRAIDLARGAEAFVSAAAVEDHLKRDRVAAEGAATDPPALNADLIDAESRSLPSIGKRPANNRPGLALTPEQREQLLERLAQGGQNAELASEFSLSAKQVQGLRMGSAREIAQRRNRHGKMDATYPATAPDPVSAEDVVRYLRQQDDVVVPAQEGEFLVNSRFRMGLAELVRRANRMRARQGKPEFPLLLRPQLSEEKVA